MERLALQLAAMIEGIGRDLLHISGIRCKSIFRLCITRDKGAEVRRGEDARRGIRRTVSAQPPQE